MEGYCKNLNWLHIVILFIKDRKSPLAHPRYSLDFHSFIFQLLCIVLFSLTVTALSISAQTKNAADVRPLTVGQPIERELKGDEAHSYSLELKAGQFLSLVVEQKGIDVELRFFDPEGKELVKVDSPNGTQGPEPLNIIAEKTGTHRLEVRSLEKDAPVGKYEAIVKDLRASTDKDRDNIIGQKAFAEGEDLRSQGTADSLRAAIKKFEDALPHFHSAEELGGEGFTLIHIGVTYYKLGEQVKALEYFNQALPLLRAVGDRDNEASTLNDIGLVYDDLGDRQKALEYFNQALPLRRAIGDKAGEGTTLSNIGVVYDGLGDLQKALEYHDQAMSLYRAIGDKYGEAQSLGNLGVVYGNLGEHQKALEYHNRALLLLRTIGDKDGEATTLNNIGSIYDAFGEGQKALEYYNQALPLRRSIGDRAGEAAVLSNIGGIYNGLGERQKALDYYNQALSLLRAVGNRAGEAVVLHDMGAVYDALGERQKALAYLNQALPLYRAVGDRDGEARAFASLRHSLVASNPRFAAFYGKLSISNFQVLRSSVSGLDKSTQQTFLMTFADAYRQAADVLIPQGRLAEAQQVLNLAKDQQYFDFSQNRSPAALIMTDREAQLAATLNQKLEHVASTIRQLDEYRRTIGQRQPTKLEPGQTQAYETDLKAATDDYLAFFEQSERDFAAPPDEKDKTPDMPDLDQMQMALRKASAATQQNTVAVYTLFGDENFRAIIIMQNDIKSVSVPIKRSVLNDKAREFWALLQSDKYDTTKLGIELYDVVFKPIEKVLPKDTKTILWSLAGNLRYIPMAALYDGKNYLAERYNNVVFTRTDEERMTRAVRRVWTGSGFGSSQAATAEILGDKIPFNALPGVPEELTAIFKSPKGGVIEGSVLAGQQFNKSSFLAAMKQHLPLVHIASHFSFRPGDEARSFLLMGDGTAYTLGEMKRETDLFKGVELLTLSACNTAAQQPDANGREIDGFAELAQRLGAGAVMATLWSVSDASTPWLMRDFYKTRQSGAGTTKADALRRAQLGLLNGTAKTTPLPDNEKGSGPKVQIVLTPDGKRDSTNTRADIIYIAKKDAPLYTKDEKRPFAHPYYWAPFILIGNWR